MISRRSFSTSLAAAAAAPLAAQSLRPNIIVILADDLGYSDTGPYGGEIETPNLNRLAKNGLRFRQFYNTARCCPTRASLMTGLYPHQTGVGHMVSDNGLIGYRGDLNRECVTIAEVMRTAGYRTMMCGKWHVTPVTKRKHNWPMQRGFDKFYGTLHGAGSFFDPTTLTEGNEFVDPGKDFYYTDALSNRAATWIGEEAGKKDPFFLYLAYTSPHWPLHALESDIRKYADRYHAGWDVLRDERHKRMIDMGIVDKRWPLTPRDPGVPAWKDAGDKEWQARRMAVYAAMVGRMDDGIGRVLKSLEEKNALDNTLIFFLADNGGCAEELGTNIKAPHVPVNAPDGRLVRKGNVPSIMPGGPDTYQSYGMPWANASNTPFRLYKHWVHEGGISSPLIAHWPKGIGARGKMTDEPGHLIDIMATCVDVGKAQYPRTREESTIQPMEGQSLLPVLQGKRWPHGRELYWEHEGNRAVRVGDRKLVSRHSQPWEMFDLKADRTEMNDLAAKDPEGAGNLESKYNRWAQRARVAPWPLPPIVHPSE